MIQLAICGLSLAWFGLMLVGSSFAIAWKYHETNNVYRIMKKQTQSALARINRVMKFNMVRGKNKESVNNVYRNIIKQKLSPNND